MKRKMNSTLLSNVGSTIGPLFRPGMVMPFSSTPRAVVTMLGSATVMRRNARDFSRCAHSHHARGVSLAVHACTQKAAARRAYLIVPQRLLLHHVHAQHVHWLLLPPAGGVARAVLHKTCVSAHVHEQALHVRVRTLSALRNDSTSSGAKFGGMAA